MNDLAAIYTRVSTQEQARDDKTSLAQQQERCLAYCHAKDWEVAGVYEDAGVSGRAETGGRPALLRLLEDAKTGAFKHVVFLKLDRFGRNTQHLLNVTRDDLDSCGVSVSSVHESIDTSSPSGRLFYTMLAAIAEFEAETINERMSDARRAKAKDKYLASTVPFGYVRENGKLKPHPQQVDVVRQMFRWALEGLGAKAIASRLEHMGIEPLRSKWGWYPMTVYKILRSPRYIGKNKYSGVDMPCPPLIDEETFNEVQAELNRHRRDSPRNITPGRVYLLQGLVRCRRCGGRYMAKTVSSGQVYLCRQRTVHARKGGHEGVQWRWHAEDLEAVIKEHVLKLLLEPEYLLRDVKVYREKVELSANALRNEEGRLRAHLTDLERQETRAQDGWLKGFYSDKQLEQKLVDLHAQQEETRTRLDALVTEEPVEELSRLEKASMLGSWLLTKHAGPLEGKSPDEVFASLFGGGHVEWALVEGEEPGTQEWSWVQDTSKPALLNETWRDVIKAVVSKVWVEDNGTLTVEGILQEPSNVVQLEVPQETRPRRRR